MSQTHTHTSIRILLAIIIITIMSLQVMATADRKLPALADQVSQYKADELLVKFKPGVAADKANVIARGTGVKSIKSFRRPHQLKSSAIDRWRHIKLNSGSDIDAIRTRLLKNPNVELVEYNYTLSAHLLPNDPEFTQLWGLHNIGQTEGGIDADIDAPETWDITTGNSNVVVAVIDTGVDYTHEDLAANMWVNAGEIAGNGVDDDGNGYIDDVHGYDFLNNDADPMDDVSHGTHVSGTIAAVANNGIGITGVSWNARIMALKFLSFEGGLASGAVSAILYATDMGATVMNNSWGGDFYSQIIKDAISDAEASGVLFVASAGNSYNDNDRMPVYPASYGLPNMITIAATDHNDIKADFSNYGANTVDLGAPGVSIYSTIPNAGYISKEGTSMAAPHVSGAAALLLSKYPLLNYTQIKSRLMASADTVTGMRGLTASNGRLNIFSAIDDDTINPAAINDLAVNTIEEFSITLNWTASGDDINSGTPHHYDLRYSSTPIDTSNFDTASPVDYVFANGPAGTPESFTVTNLKPNTEYYFAIKAVDNLGNTSDLSNNITVNTLPARAVFYEDFEWGGDNWDTLSTGNLVSGSSIAWHLSTHRSNSPVTALYYGNDATLSYKTDSFHNGKITSALIDLTKTTQAGLYFNHFLDIKGTDAAIVQVSIGENGVITVLDDLLTLHKGTDGKFVPMYIDLSSYVGQKIHLKFSILSSASNLELEAYEGWVLDDIAVYVPETINNQPPSASAGGPYTIARNQLLTFNGNASTDPDGDSLLFKWDFGNGSKGMGANATHHYAASGTYTATLIVNDGALDSAPVSTSVTVTNQAPVADTGGPYSGYKNVAINFDGLASTDADGDALTYLWDFGDGTSGTGSSPSHSYASLGDYSVQLTVNDGEADSASISSTVSINNRAPSADAGGPYTVYKTEPVSFNGLGSVDADADPLTYQWDFADGTTGTGATPMHSYSASGIYNVSLIVHDGLENSAPATSTVTVNNHIPVAHAGGPYSAFRNDVINFNGLGSTDSDGDALSYLWSFGDDSTATAATPAHAYTSSGSYSVTLIVNDGESNSLVSTASVSINNRTPIADAGGPYSGYKNDTIQFNGQNSSDADGDTLTYYWTFYENCNFSSCRGSGVSPSHTYNERGDYIATLTVSDGELSSTSTATVTINNQLPTAVVNGPYSSSKSTAIHFSSYGTSDPESDALSYHWDFGDGTTSIEPSPNHTYNITGNYVVTLTVNDGYGDSVPATTTATINNRIPTANTGGPYSGYKQTAITFDGSDSQDPDGDVLSYQWDFGDGTSGTGVTPVHSYSNSGTYTVTLMVTDGEANSALASTTVSIVNRAPLANLGGQYGDVYKNDPVSFDGSGSTDADGDALSYQWNFGDGNTGTGINPVHSYANAGTYTISLTVNDGETSSNTVSTSIRVLNRAPVANAGADQVVISRSVVMLDGSASTDSDGSIVSYSWAQSSGTSVILNNANTVKPTFTAPGLKGAKQLILTFALTVTDDDGAQSAVDEVMVTVVKN